MKNIKTELFQTSSFRVSDKDEFLKHKCIQPIIDKMKLFQFNYDYADDYIALVMTPEMIVESSFDTAVDAMRVIEEMIRPSDTCKVIILSAYANEENMGSDYYSCLVRRKTQKHYMDRCDSNATYEGWGKWTGKFVAPVNKENSNDL